ncbi:MAG: hypothetical protein IT361_09720 [Gemmatimonadaceae bacterium]|nr:hypothetical protein [Gemmatimonadaceae bacterium]
MRVRNPGRRRWLLAVLADRTFPPHATRRTADNHGRAQGNVSAAAILEPVRATFRAVASTVIPEVSALDHEGWSALEAAVERALAKRPEAMRRQLLTLLRLIEYLPVARPFGRFSHLREDRRLVVLRRLERSPLPLMRRGIWGLRTLVMLGYYTQPAIQDALGYRAHRDGWAARRRLAPIESRGVPPITLDMPAVPDTSTTT